ARLLGDAAEEPAWAACEEAGLPANRDAVDGRLHRACVVDDLLLLHAARRVRAVGEHDDGLAAGLVLDAAEAVVDRVVEAGAAPGLQALHELLEPAAVPGELGAALDALVEGDDEGGVDLLQAV